MNTRESDIITISSATVEMETSEVVGTLVKFIL